MANYQGLNCIMGEITAMVSDARYPHDQHIYDYFAATEKFVRTVVPQLFQDCMEQFREQLVVEFENAKGLHVALPSGEKSSEGAAYLHVAGSDGKFYPAFSRIEKGKLVVWHPNVAQPVKVKYCTEDYCKGNIYNGAGVPAYPFEY